ncbi:ABC transporter permease [Actinoalloteichus hymeniacidonis]|uniref:ABC-type dipeptide/oligopeptide/nickel transport system, permease component n=1 Tax=Actinoalloteichus hymeniacidonis TaxID=340345 RepID=A0AAC9HQV2_9PSEU|nr:ABC transporter permease subunit [Actinoalloteichus hymeniacidonis]AOS63708.1 ABC-type dipeptide/oligopeptide/nickel transport system, permease component [Actinoalloteichus hymeniacidonis]MBB5908239.1 peptide/nickel transport system permease protein [Actinoalloteichus hymeniacidonis]
MRTGRRGIAVALFAVVLFGLLAPLLPLGSATEVQGPPFAAASGAHPLGTDFLGRDTLARVAAGGQTLIMQALTATATVSVVGVLLGAVTGMTTRRWSAVPLRILDGLSALPPLFILLLLASGTPGNDLVVVVAIVAVTTPFSVRVLREATRQVYETAFARVARARGDSVLQRLRHDILPGITEAMWADAGVRFVAAVQLAATAGFLGLTAGAPAANWGRMVRENVVGVGINPLPVLVPAALIIALALGFTLLIDRLSARTGADIGAAAGA